MIADNSNRCTARVEWYRQRSVRINAALDEVFRQVVAAGKRRVAVPIWGSSEAYYVSALVVDALQFSAIAPAS